MRPTFKINKKPAGIDQFNLNNPEIQDFIQSQIYTKGFEFNTTAGTANTFPIQLGGKCRKLHGIVVYNDLNNVVDPDKISLVINSEQLIDKAVWWAYCPVTGVGNPAKQDQFFSLPRPLSGSDDVQLVWDSANAHKIFIVFYLSDK